MLKYKYKDRQLKTRFILNKQCCIFVSWPVDWLAFSSTRRYRVMVTDGRPAGAGLTHSAAPLVEAFSPKSRTGTSRLVSSPHYRFVSMFRGVSLSWDHCIWCIDSAILVYALCLLLLLSYFVCVLFAQLCLHVCRCSWPTHPMCSCWNHARMYLNSWITRLRCARVFSASTGTWSWNTRWIHRHGQWDIQIYMDNFSPVFQKKVFDGLTVFFAGSRCCRYCWGSQRQWWRGHRKTKEKTALLKV